MIKIHLTGKLNYFELREKYFERILKYIAFDKEDIIPGEKPGNSKKTEETAYSLERDFPELYKFLFYPDSGTVNRNNLKSLLIGPDSIPKSLGGCGEIKTMHEYISQIVEKCPMPEDQKKREAAKESCQKIFQYKKFIKNQEDAHWLLRNLDVRVCPYCNRVYTVTLPTREELQADELFKATRATFDHFYSQDKYPYLALSLFNLVPSCYACNLNKRNLENEIVYPYDEEFGKDAVFRVIPDLAEYGSVHVSNPLSYLHGESDAFHIKFMGKEGSNLQNNTSLEERLSGIEDVEFRKRVKGTIDVFHLEELYKEHKMEIQDILKNRYYFNKEYVKSVICPLLQQIKKEGGEDNVDSNGLEAMAMDMLFFSRIHIDEWGKRPLAKLISDILDQVSE